MKRDLTHKLQTWKESPDRKPLVLRGARQVGKTYILKHFGEKFFPRVHYLNFETGLQQFEKMRDSALHHEMSQAEERVKSKLE